MKRLITNTDIYKGEKIDIKNFFAFQESLKVNTIKKLKEITFHNIGIVCAYYKTCLNIDISNYLGNIPSSVDIRHDIVHRNGKTKDDEIVNILKDDISNLIYNIRICIEQINIDFERERLVLGNKGSMSDINTFLSPFLNYNSFQ